MEQEFYKIICDVICNYVELHIKHALISPYTTSTASTYCLEVMLVIPYRMCVVIVIVNINIINITLLYQNKLHLFLK